MSKIAAVAGLAVLMAACGDKSADTPAADTTAVAAAPAPAPAGATHDVNMVMEGTAYKFVPADLSVRVGDQVVFHNVSGGPHNVAFWADSIPAGAAATWVVSAAGVSALLSPQAAIRNARPATAAILLIASLPPQP